MNVWVVLLWIFELLSGAFIIACIGLIFNLPFWILYILCGIWGWAVGRDVGKRINNKKKDI